MRLIKEIENAMRVNGVVGNMYQDPSFREDIEYGIEFTYVVPPDGETDAEAKIWVSAFIEPSEVIAEILEQFVVTNLRFFTYSK